MSVDSSSERPLSAAPHNNESANEMKTPASGTTPQGAHKNVNALDIDTNVSSSPNASPVLVVNNVRVAYTGPDQARGLPSPVHDAAGKAPLWDKAAIARYQAQVMSAYAAQHGAVGGGPYFSIDVECVATGPKHNQRAAAQVSLVDQWERVLLNFYIKPKEKVFSYLHSLTGLTEELLDKGVSMEEAVQMIRATLPKNAILVGQNILKDVTWLGLQEGKDFAGLQDLVGLWRVYNEKYKGYTYFSLHHEAKALLGIVQKEPHHAVTDAIISIRLFNLHKRLEGNKEEMQRAHQLLLQTPIDPSFAKKNAQYDGVCMGNKKTCVCQAPFFW